MELTEKLISLRKENGLTQLELAEKMEVSRQTISRWESGEVIPTTDNLRRLSELYGVSVGYLLNDSEPRSTAVAVAEKAEEQAEKYRGKKPTFIVVAIAAAIALLVAVYSTGYGKGTKDTKPTYPLYTDVLDEENLEGGFDVAPLASSPVLSETLDKEDCEGMFDIDKP